MRCAGGDTWRSSAPYNKISKTESQMFIGKIETKLRVTGITYLLIMSHANINYHAYYFFLGGGGVQV
jgi:hypothetical protein